MRKISPVRPWQSYLYVQDVLCVYTFVGEDNQPRAFAVVGGLFSVLLQGALIYSGSGICLL
jgi:hypothetical protein